jgi:hypothetical protein
MLMTAAVRNEVLYVHLESETGLIGAIKRPKCRSSLCAKSLVQVFSAIALLAKLGAIKWPA